MEYGPMTEETPCAEMGPLNRIKQMPVGHSAFHPPVDLLVTLLAYPHQYIETHFYLEYTLATPGVATWPVACDSTLFHYMIGAEPNYHWRGFLWQLMGAETHSQASDREKRAQIGDLHQVPPLERGEPLRRGGGRSVGIRGVNDTRTQLMDIN
ncbi:hypothetical protein STEG23_018531 [Scotinomys teguina]